MLQFPRWKIVFVLFVTAFFFVAALPNMVPEKAREKLGGLIPNPVPLGLDLRGGSHLLG